jgi:HD-like signal output (HDOD) protein
MPSGGWRAPRVGGGAREPHATPQRSALAQVAVRDGILLTVPAPRQLAALGDGSVARRLLQPAGMPAITTRAGGGPRVWDPAPTSAAQERFYRELMATEQLPSAPEVAQRILVAVNRDDARVDQLAALIARDQSLAARLLRLANSAFFGMRAHITSIPQAVTLLGFGRVRDIVLGLSIWNVFEARDPAGRRYRRSMWIHSALVAAAAKTLAEQIGADGGTAFAAGLLHDVGKLVLGLRLGGTYWALLDDAAEHGQRAAAVEHEGLGCHHGTVGGWLLQLWQLPQTLVEPVALHEAPFAPEFGLDVTSVVAIADRLVTATDPESGLAREDVLAEVRGFAPGLVGTQEWREMYGRVAREQQAISGLFAAQAGASR